MGTCRECQQPVSTEAVACPGCGVPNPLTAARPAAGTAWWRQGRVQAVAVGLAVAAAYGGRYVAQQSGWVAKGSVSGDELAQGAKAAYEAQFPGLQLDVSCPPSVPVKKHKTADCSMTNQNGVSSALFVAFTDLAGHVQYQVQNYQVLYPGSG